MSDVPSRRGYLDILRGVAVLIMIEAHLLDSWMRVPDRQTREFAQAMILGGFGAPLFLFLAGVAVPLSAASKMRKTGSADGAARAVARRGLEIFGLAFLFRLQAWVLGWSAPSTLLRVDILNIMGPAIMAAAALWGAARTVSGRIAACAAAMLACTLLAPIVRTTAILSPLPDPIEAYLRPVGAMSLFTIFPWAGFVFAGAIIGVVLDSLRARQAERPTHLAFLLGGAAMAFAAYRLSFLPTLFPRSHFWTTSPAFFFLRLGIMVAAVGVVYVWEQRPGGAAKWSPLAQLGRTSLFLYWIHVEIVYGLVSRPLHKALSWTQSWVAFAIFCVFMLFCSMLKDWCVARWSALQEARSSGGLVSRREELKSPRGFSR